MQVVHIQTRGKIGCKLTFFTPLTSPPFLLVLFKNKCWNVKEAPLTVRCRFMLCFKLQTCCCFDVQEKTSLLHRFISNDQTHPNTWENKIMIMISHLFHIVSVRIIVLRSCTLIGDRNEKRLWLMTSNRLHENYLGGRWALSLRTLSSAPLLKLPDTFSSVNPLGVCRVRGGRWVRGGFVAWRR